MIVNESTEEHWNMRKLSHGQVDCQWKYWGALQHEEVITWTSWLSLKVLRSIETWGSYHMDKLIVIKSTGEHWNMRKLSHGQVDCQWKYWGALKHEEVITWTSWLSMKVLGSIETWGSYHMDKLIVIKITEEHWNMRKLSHGLVDCQWKYWGALKHEEVITWTSWLSMKVLRSIETWESYHMD